MLDMNFNIHGTFICGFSLDGGHWHHTWKFWKYKWVTATELAKFIAEHPQHNQIGYTKTWSLWRCLNNEYDKKIVWVVVGVDSDRKYFKLVSSWFEMFENWFMEKPLDQPGW